MLVSVIVPCRNEAEHIESLLDSILRQALPAQTALEVIVADGLSDDGTRAILSRLQARDARLIVIDNVKRITSAALNLAVARARGEVVVRMDVHTQYAEDYVARCIEALHESGATCVGGAWRPVGKEGRQLAIALAFQSAFGSGGAASRRVSHSGPVDTVYLGAWRREDLLRLGGFDESLVRNQDDELNLRIVRSGGLVLQSSTIRSWYTPRASFRALFAQFYQYGYWKVPVIRKHRLPASARHIAPFAYLLLLAAAIVFAPWWAPALALAAALIFAYAGSALVAAWAIARARRNPAMLISVTCAFACMHFGYGLGFARGILDFAILDRAPTQSATRLTR